MKTLVSTGMLLAAAVVAQDFGLTFFQQAVPAPPPGALSRPANIQFISGQMVSSGVKGSPYSGEMVVETTQVLADGNRIVDRNTTRQFRDSEGRERREMGGGIQMIMISDPVAGVSYALDANRKTAQKTPMGDGGRLRDAVMRVEQMTELRHEAEAGVNVRAANGTMIVTRSDIRISAPGSASSSAEENLGARVVEGLAATGTRRKTTIPAGQIGNDRPIESSVETWFSPDLKMTILSETSDPRMGKTVMKLTNVSRAEPSRSLFEVPAGYSVTEGPAFTFTEAMPGRRILGPALEK